MRWRLILPILGLSLFAFVGYGSFRNRVPRPANSRYFGRYLWWSTVRLDSDTLNKHHRAPIRCKENSPTEVCFDLDDLQWDRSPEWQANVLIFSALPAFLVGAAIVELLGRFGVSQVSSFMVSMPLLLAAWYYFVGWWIDRRRSTRPVTG